MERKREMAKGFGIGGQEIELAVVRPGHKVLQGAQLQYNLKVAGLIRKGADGGERLLLRSEVEQHMERLGIWTAADRARFVKMQEEIGACEIALRQGGVKLSEARAMALHIGDLRNELLALYAKRSQLDGTTIEAVAENHKFDWLVTQCVVRADTGGPYFADLDDYAERSDEPVAVQAATKLAKMLYGYDEGFADNLFENRWLKQYGFRDEQGRLTNRQGQLVDRDGRLVDENGRYIDREGQYVDRDGNRIDADGNLIVETKPFIDDETGAPIAFEAPSPVGQPAPSKGKGRGKRSKT